MDQKRRASLAGGLVLILIGAWFLSVELTPGLWAWAYGKFTWPIPIMGIGALLLVIGLVTWTPGLAVPACIVGGIGALLFWQNITGSWASWAYAWALIPGFVGVGIMLSGLLSLKPRTIIGGGWVVVISLMLFAIFGSFLGGWGVVGQYWPVGLIALGMLLLAQNLFHAKA